MTLSHRVLAEAEAELEEAALLLEGKEQGLGRRLVAAFDAIVKRACEFPDSFPIVPDHRGRTLRCATIRTFHHGVIYLRLADELVVVAVAHAKRDPEYWRDRI